MRKNNPDFKVVKHLKINWLKNASERCGAMQQVINSKPLDHLVIWSKTKSRGNMWADVNSDDLLRLVQKDNCIYEVIDQFPHKVYFDIDADNKDYDIYSKIIPKIEELFENADIAVSGSKSEVRQSYHIVLNNYLIKNEEERETIKLLSKYLKETFDDSFDTKVYTKNRFFKCVNQSKEDGRIQSVIYNDDLKKHLITAFFTNVYNAKMSFNFNYETKTAIEVEKTKITKFDLGDLPKMSLNAPDKFDINNFTPLQALQLLPINKEFYHKYTHLIARFCFYNQIEFETFYSWYKNKNESESNYKKWMKHWSVLSKFPEVNIKKIKTLILKYYPKIRRDTHFNNFERSFILPETIKVDALSQDHFRSSKYTILNTGMGSGKTYQTVKYLKDKDSFIWITPNIALAQNTTQRLKADDINVAFYKDFKTSSEKKNTIPLQDKLIICINSLFYTEINYKVVVIDEIETVLDRWFNNSTLTTEKKNCWERFIKILKNAEKVILLDAFTSKKTIDFIQSLSENDVNIYELNKSVVNRTIKTKSNFTSWCGGIINTLKENKKVFIYYPYKDGCKDYPSMQSLQEVFEKNTNKKGLSYNADSDDKILKTLDNVNDNWEKVDFVMTNNKINVGINYEKFDFDSVFLSIASFSSPRDIIQVSYRCRQLKSNNIFICYLEGMKNTTFQDDSNLVDNCPIYQKLVKNILIEKYSPLKATFNLFCNLAHYKIDYSKEALNKELDQYIEKLINDTDLSYSYSTIKDINNEELEKLTQKIYQQEATLDDKLAIKKYYFKNQFINKEKEEIAIAFNEKYINFISAIKKLKYQESNIFEEIKEFNKWESILPTDDQINKNKLLSKELVNKIFEKFYFKDLNKNSSSNCIVKNIYNTYFEKQVIQSKKESEKNYKSFIPEMTRDIYNFVMTNLYIYNKPKIEIQFLDFSGLDYGLNNGLLNV